MNYETSRTVYLDNLIAYEKQLAQRHDNLSRDLVETTRLLRVVQEEITSVQKAI